MKRPASHLLLLSLAILLTCTAAFGAEKQPFRPTASQGGELRYIDGIPVLTLRGSPEEMGRQQAAIIGSPIRRLLVVPHRIVESNGWGAVWPAATMAATTLMAHAAEPHRRELEAIATGLKLTADEKAGLLVGNVVAELRRFDRCSALIVEPPRSATGKMLFGRNYDFATFGVLDRLSLVIVYRPTGRHAFASVGYPGSAGVMSGMNDAGLAVACLDSGPAKDGSARFDPRGAPMLLTFRRVLEECATIEEAQKLLRNTRHTTWFNLAACDRKHSAVFEITTKQVAVRGPENDLLTCTNHFRTAPLAVSTNSDRHDRLLKFGSTHERFTWQDVAAAMHAVNLGERTLQTMVFEPDALVLRLSIDRRPASAGPFVELKLEGLFKPAREPVSDRMSQSGGRGTGLTAETADAHFAR